MIRPDRLHCNSARANVPLLQCYLFRLSHHSAVLLGTFFTEKSNFISVRQNMMEFVSVTLVMNNLSESPESAIAKSCGNFWNIGVLIFVDVK